MNSEPSQGPLLTPQPKPETGAPSSFGFRISIFGFLSSVWVRWVRFLDQREAGTTLALWRIACGLCVVGAVGAVVLAGTLPTFWLDTPDGGYTTPATPWLFRWLGGVSRTTVHSVVAATIIGGLLTTVGLGGRLPIFVSLQGFLALVSLNGNATGSHDFVISNGLWLLVLSRSTATLSLDCRLRTGHWTSDKPVPAWPRYLAIFQLVLMYWTTGLQKLSATWTPVGGFSALYYILQQPNWQRWDMTWVAWVYPLTQVATAISWLWEITAPLLLLAFWYRATADRPGWLRRLFNRVNFRRLFVVIGVMIHLGILLFLEVGPFSWITLSFYLCLYHPDEWKRAANRSHST
jgi:hypothetical protein